MDSLRMGDLKTESYDVVDSYAWVKYFLGSKFGEKVKEFLRTISRIYTPSIVLAESAKKYPKEGVGENIIEERLLFLSEVYMIVEIDSALSLEAARAYIDIVEHAEEHRIRESLV